jgi:hypothetical protein
MVSALYKRAYALLNAEQLKGTARDLNTDYHCQRTWLCFFSCVSNAFHSVTADYLPPAWAHVAHAKQMLYEAIADSETARQQLTDIARGARNAQTATWMGAQPRYFEHLLVYSSSLANSL